MSIPSFGKIWRVGSGYVPDILRGEVEITEKIDGSFFGFGIDEDEKLVMRSKGQQLEPGTEQNLFSPAVSWVVDNMSTIEEVLAPNFFVYGETLAHERHNIVQYKRVPHNNIIVFGAIYEGEYINSYDKLCNLSEALGLETVPLLYHGNITVEELNKFLEIESCLGGTKVEGIVVKNFHQPVFMGEKKMPSMAKLVREDFKEVHDRTWKALHTDSGKTDAMIDSFRSEARWEKAVQHLEEQGLLEHDPRDIGKLLTEVEKDLIEEEEENIKATLWHIYKGKIVRRAKVGFPEWYKEKLIRNMK